jgi:hypothetical protein
MFKKLSKALPVLVVLGAGNLATATKPVAAASTTSLPSIASSPQNSQWWSEAFKEGNKGAVAGAVGGAVACAVGAPGALAGAVVGGAGGYIGGIAAYALFGVTPPVVRGPYSAVPDTAFNQ